MPNLIVTSTDLVSREVQLQRAQLCYEVERYYDTCYMMRLLIETSELLNTVEEMKLFENAYQIIVNDRRHSLRKLYFIEKATRNTKRQRQMIDQYRLKIQKELHQICKAVLLLLNKNLLPNTTRIIAKIIYYTMVGTYNGYISEICDYEIKKDLLNKADQAFQIGFSMASQHMSVTDPLRLDITSKYAFFLYDILGDKMNALKLVVQTLEAAQHPSNIDALNTPDAERDSIMVNLYDIMMAWRRELLTDRIFKRIEDPLQEILHSKEQALIDDSKHLFADAQGTSQTQ